MPEVQEVFRMATNKVKPDPNALERQLRRQRSAARSSRVRVYVAVAVVLVTIGLAALAITRLGDTPIDEQPGSSASFIPAGLPAGTSPQTSEIVDLQGHHVTALSGFPEDAFSLSLAPDPTKPAGSASIDQATIAFVTTPEGSYGNHVAVMRADGTDQRMIATPGLDVSGAAISPDGARIAFEASDADSNTDIYVVGVDGSGLRRLTTDAATDQFPQWSPDSSTIVYDNAGAHEDADPQFSRSADIWTVEADGGTPTRVTHAPGADSTPSFSPDGSKIVYFHDGGIWFADWAGGHPRQLQDEGGTGGFTPRWSPDQTKIAYTIYDDRYRPQVARSGFFRDEPLVTLVIYDVSSGTRTSFPGVAMASDYNAPVWLPSSDQLLIRGVPTHVP
jgi:dipeptidyl aminopeptidase/acylaminoacyl peptidase